MDTARAATSSRFAAKMIDLSLSLALAAWVPYPVGPLLGFLYSLVCDGLPLPGFRGQSIGKRFFSIRVIHIRRREPASLRDSIVRNIPVGFATLFGMIPFWGWAVAGLVGLPLMAVELYLISGVGQGRRLGDAMADTSVVSDV